jgi:ParB-like chromosome segregation protein Spo0J
MVIREIPIEELKPAKYNPRKMSRHALGGLKKNIQEYGMVDPLTMQ